MSLVYIGTLSGGSGGSTCPITSRDITDASTIGVSILTAANAAAILNALSLDQVSNTSDANKPLSTAANAALALLAPLNNAALTGTPTAPTATAGTNTTQIATTAFVAAAVAALINGAPGALDTLNELATALGDDANYAATVTTVLAGKQPLDTDLTAIAALTTTAFGRSLLTQADAPTARTTLGAGTSNLALGTTSTTALAGNTTASGIGGVPADYSAGGQQVRFIGAFANTQPTSGVSNWDLCFIYSA